MTSHWYKRLVKISTSTLIILPMFLPTGSFAGIPIKNSVYFCCVLALFACWFRGAKINSVYISLSVISLLFVAFFSLVGSLQATAPFYYVFFEGVSFVSTISMVLLILMANSYNAIEDKEIVLSAFYGTLIFSLWKFVALLLLYLDVVSIYSLISFFEKYMNFKPVTLKMPGGFWRVTFSGQDLAAVVFLFLVPAYPRIFSKVPLFLRIIFMFTGTVAVVTNYSRFYFIFLAILWIYLFLFKLSFKYRLLVCFIVAVILALSFPWIMEAYELRFNSVQAKGGDITRYFQTLALLDAWEDAPILGGGLGYYAKSYVRSMYIYEVQWVAFLAKLGIVGIFFLGFLIFLLFYKILSGKRSLDHYVLAFILLFLLLSGFTNPLLISASAGILYALPLMLASILRKELLKSNSPSVTDDAGVGLHSTTE